METLSLPLFAAAALVFISVLAGLFSTRVGFSFLLVFLFAGILAGEDGVLGYRFDDFGLSFWVGNVALAVILLDGGLRTAYATFRTGLKPAALLATIGVLICAGITALAGVWFVGLDWQTALLLGAIVGSTDAAAVFALLTRSGVTLNERVAATLEIESGVNDPMAVYLTLALIALLGTALGGSMSGASTTSTIVVGFVQQFGWGSLVGVLCGFAMAALLHRIESRDAGGGVTALLIVAAGLSVFAATGLLGGSGFLAVYLFGLIVANRAARIVIPTLAPMDGYAWLAQAVMFLLLGLLVTPSTMWQSVESGLVIAATLILVARPAAVWLCLLPFRFTPRETWFIAWVGLRGAVPIVLALFPLLAGTPQAYLLFNIAFVVVLASLLIQGSTIGLVARRLGVALPDPADERQHRAVFRDFVLDPGTPVSAVCEFYGLPAPDDASATLGDWMAAEIGRPPVAGDTVALGTATFVIREMDGARIVAIGLGLRD
ncbi:potassium/proton antiporter [Piscinibacter sakaiensis]|uniref:potassium/proton antiporter n=1 Tax=Piscinibacter sakaiensis TaxID=1547922 RepID=UPI003AAF4728